jgi:hypothetical protein
MKVTPHLNKVYSVIPRKTSDTLSDRRFLFLKRSAYGMLIGAGVGAGVPQPPPLLLLPPPLELLQPLLPLLLEPPPRPPRPPRPPQPLPPPLTSSIWLVLSSCKFKFPNFIFYLFLVASRKNTIEGTLSEILQSEG